jgi:hypothetical protein
MYKRKYDIEEDNVQQEHKKTICDTKFEPTILSEQPGDKSPGASPD